MSKPDLTDTPSDETVLQKAFRLAGGPKAVIPLLGISPAGFYLYRSHKREFPPEYCALLEAATNFQVTRRELRPDDWWLIWPELVDPDHPPGKAAPLAEREGVEGEPGKETRANDRRAA